MAKPQTADLERVNVSDNVIADFIADGVHLFEARLDVAACADLLGAIRATRRFDASLFLSEAAFDADPLYVGVNPRAGRNLLERFEHRLNFVERAPHIVEALTTLLGDDYEILNKKVVCGVPASAVPPWLQTRIHGNPVNNLGAYVRPEHRDVTYFYGIDFHQDLIDYKARAADFVTLYVYLHPVTAADAPLYVLEGSHVLGGSVFPHTLTPAGPGAWSYVNGPHGQATVRQRVLIGGTGFAAVWHACTLHGTQPDAADHERISLRYLVARGPAQTRSGIDKVNATLRGPLSLTDTRADLAADGSAVIRHNTVNAA